MKILNKFFSFFKKPHEETMNLEDEQYVGVLSFKITNKKNIDINCSLPDLKNQSIIDVENLAKIYAEFLFYINEGFLKDDIIGILQKDIDSGYYKQDDDKAKATLFIDNLLFNWAMAHIENRKKITKSEKSHQPMIKPSSVFNISR